MTTILTDIPAEPKRDRWGRYIIDGQGYTRATTIAKTLDDTYNLAKWQQRMAIYGITQREDLLATAQAHNPTDDKQTYNQLADNAIEAAQGKAKANLGTAIHRLTQDLTLGRKTLADIPEAQKPACENYLKILEIHGIELDPNHVEQVVIDTGRQIAGTMDNIATLADGRRVVADLKTGADLSWSWLSIHVQLAIYAHHTHTYNYTTETKSKKLDVDLQHGLIIHVPSDGTGATLYLVDLEAGYDAYMLSLEVRELRRTAKKLAAVYNPRPTKYRGATARRDWLADRIQTIAAVGPAAVTELRNRWPADTPTPLPTEPTATQIESMSKALSAVESAYEIPFSPHGLPGETTNTKQLTRKSA